MYCKKCVCEYDGTAYSGWQYQSHANTIQSLLEEALSTLYNTPIAIIGSGRTDAGVHAYGQVFSYRTEIHRDNHSIICALNSMLPRDIAVLEVEDAPDGFHAQFSALHKTYLYRILNRSSRAALDWNRAWFRRSPIDVERLRAILKGLEGTHDFAAFCVKKSLKENTVRTIRFITVEKNGDYIDIRLNAGGFLHNMVRIIVGTAVNLTLEGACPQEALDILASKDRRRAGVTAPARGLYLEKVFYE